MDLRHRQLLEQLAACPVVELRGVVGPNGAGLSKTMKDPRWMLRFGFEAWRMGDRLATQPITVRRHVADDERARFDMLMTPYSVVSIRARVSVDLVEALLEEFVGVVTDDSELNAIAARLQEPVTCLDPALGTFTLERQYDWFSATVNWEGKPITLTLPEREFNEGLRIAHALFREQARWNQRILEYAAEELVSLKNESWRDEDECAVTSDEFKARMSLYTISVNSSGTFEFWYHDDDLFYGHSILVKGSPVDGPTSADIAG